MNKRGFMNKKGVTAFVAIILVVLVAIALAGVVKLWVPGKIITETTTTTTAGDTTTPPQKITLTGCPTDSTATFKARAKIPKILEPTLTYVNGVTIYAYPDNGGELINVSTSGTTGLYGTEDNIVCDRYGSGPDYTLIAVDSAGASGGTVGETFTPSKAEEPKTIEVTKMSKPEVKIYDVNADGYLYNGSKGGDAFNVNTFAELPATFSNDSTGAGLNMTVDKSYSYEIQIRESTSDNQFGNYDTWKWTTKSGVTRAPRCFVAVDTDTTDWLEPTSVSWNGAKRTDMSDELESNDGNKLAGYEYSYLTGPITDDISRLGFKMQSKSAIEPDFDSKFYFICEGLYKSSEEEDTIYLGAFDDSSSQTEVHGSGYIVTLNETDQNGIE